MTPKIVLSVGNCSADTRMISALVSRLGGSVIRVDLHRDVAENITKHSPSLIMVNRINDSDGSDGLDLIRELKQTQPAVPVMLISNYESAQNEAESAGAVRGFGKAALGSQDTAALIERFLK